MKANGVTHANRCACPLCDPSQTRVAAARKEAAERRRLERLRPALPLPLDRPRPPPLRVLESARDRRFKELLRTGIGFTRAADQVEAEFAKGDQHG